MANGREFYTLETQAHRDGYKMRDVDGKTLEDDRLWKGWGAPEVLKMGFVDSKDRVLERWEANVVSLLFAHVISTLGRPSQAGMVRKVWTVEAD